jgi:hypothetical protein
VVEFGYFRRSAQQSAVDSLNHMTETFDQLVVKFFARLDEITKNATIPVEAASRTSGAGIAALSKTIGATLAAGVGRLSAETEKLSDQVAMIAAALDAMTVRFNAMQTPERVIEVRLEPIADLLTQAVERAIAQSESQAKAVQEALAIASSAAVSSNDLVAALRGEFGATTAANRSAIEAAMTMIKSTEAALNEITVNSRDYVEALGIVVARADETMRTFTDILVQSSAESAAWADRLSETLPEIEAKVQALAVATDRISLLVNDFRHRQIRPEPEAVG